MYEAAIIFTPDGVGHCIFTELVPLGEIGHLAVKRATTIEFDNISQNWRVRDLTGFALYCSPSRQDCLDWERRYLQTQEDMKHELQPGAGAVAAGA